MRIFVDHLRAPADWFVVVSMQAFGTCVFLLIIYVRLRTGLWWCLQDTTTNQSAGARR
jgi:hypothetical protein